MCLPVCSPVRLEPAWGVRGLERQERQSGPLFPERGHARVWPGHCLRGRLCRPDRELEGALLLPVSGRLWSALVVYGRLFRLRLELLKGELVNRPETRRGRDLLGVGFALRL